MNGFLKSLFHRMNKNTKIIRMFSRQSKIKPKKHATPRNYLNILEI